VAGIRQVLARRSWGERLPKRIAWLSPMPPARTGIASYSSSVLDGLHRIGFPEGLEIEAIWPAARRYEGALPWYALCVYHLGNNVEFHRDIYRDAIGVPGLVVIHDLALDDFVKGMVARGDPVGRRSAREAIRNRERIRSRTSRLPNRSACPGRRTSPAGLAGSSCTRSSAGGTCASWDR
jgi:hypothetical protein